MKKKLLSILLASTLLLGSLAACSQKNSSDNSQSNGGSVSLKLWVDPGSGDFYKSVVADFVKQNKDKNYKIDVVESDTGKAQEFIKKDPNAAADVFSMPHDQLGQMVDSGIIYENTKYKDEVKNNNTEQAAAAATYNGKTYGYPYGIESLCLYYDKSKLSAEDVKTFETLTSKGKIGLNFAEPGANYVVLPYFISNGTEIYGANGEEPNGTTLNSSKGLDVLKWIASQKSNENVVQASSDIMSQLQNGKIAALVSGPWGKDNVQKILGDNMGIAVYPKVNFGDGEVQMKAFLGVKLYGVNANTKHPVEAMALAEYLSSEAVQEKAFKEKGITPSDKKLQESKEVQDNKLSSIQIKMATPEYSVLMPKISQMVGFWPPADALINDAYKGNIPESAMQSKLDQLVKDTSAKK